MTGADRWMATRQYYKRYCTIEGYNPLRDHTTPALEHPFWTHAGRDDALIDIRCGDGGTGGHYLTACAHSPLGIDVAAHTVALARRRRLEARQTTDASDSSLDDCEVPAANCGDVLEHLFEPQVATVQALGVLRPGARYRVTVSNAAYWRERFDALIAPRHPRKDDPARATPSPLPHFRSLRSDTLKEMLARMSCDRVCFSGAPTLPMTYAPLIRAIPTCSDLAHAGHRVTLRHCSLEAQQQSPFVTGMINDAEWAPYPNWRTLPRRWLIWWLGARG